MFNGGPHFRRSGRGEDRFYEPPAKARSARRGQLNQDTLRRALNDVTASRSKSSSLVSKKPPKKQAEAAAGVVPAPLKPAVSPLCNLKRFLESVTPSVPAQYLSKRSMRGWRNRNTECRPYYVLGDLWESFKEWSAYGAGVPLILNESDSVVQYFVPFLSGIQLYGSRLKTTVKSSRPGEDSEGDFRDSSSDGSSDYEPDHMSYLRGKHTAGEASTRMEHLSLHDQHIALQGGISSDEGEFGNSQSCLLFEYLERDSPFGREPLADKLSDLALRFPELKVLRSCDLLSSSWISVAWYPIYRIPMGPTLKDLDACFLTFHHLYTPMPGNQSAYPRVPAPVVTHPSEVDCVPKFFLPVFGLASYKFKSSLWTDNDQLVSSLLQAAHDWLSLHLVNHPDFRFFCRR